MQEKCRKSEIRKERIWVFPPIPIIIHPYGRLFFHTFAAENENSLKQK